ncbi:hypothetical protein FA15DRAFT_666781 [Coprinopsis marcescibilis]|uniref:Zn(2)-C6 fungal-type domain-containing protein n=1 Tax=Coprinopsis marcescibilis TaxID=230819 RepID=A0A5C3L2W1_COPMA|nr:hypothetical protein FA15DRAFT_666781 [Coprinopsis marcescibilis]
MPRSHTENLECAIPKRPSSRRSPSVTSRRSNSITDMFNASRREIGGLGALAEAAAGQLPASLSPHPCDRCVRTNKTCRGPAGSRCEYCKRLKQKCSNSNGSARGRQSAVAKPVSINATHGIGAPDARPTTPVPDNTEAVVGRPLKRRLDEFEDAPSSASPYMKRESDDDHDDDDYDGHEPPAKLNKRRRTALNSAMIASRVLKQLKELDEASLRMNEAYVREFNQFRSVLAALTTDMTNLVDDREPSL